MGPFLHVNGTIFARKWNNFARKWNRFARKWNQICTQTHETLQGKRFFALVFVRKWNQFARKWTTFARKWNRFARKWNRFCTQMEPTLHINGSSSVNRSISYRISEFQNSEFPNLARLGSGRVGWTLNFEPQNP